MGIFRHPPQPVQKGPLAPQLTFGVWGADPPFSAVARGRVFRLLIEAWQPGPWGAQWRPFTGHIPPPAVNNPPFFSRLRGGPVLGTIVRAWDPPDPPAQWARRLPADFLSVVGPSLYVYVWKRIA